MKINYKKLIGNRVRLKRDVDRFPDFIAWQGQTGVIDEANKYGFSVRLDEKLHGAKEWDNCILWHDIYRDQFEDDVEILEDEVQVEIERFNPNI